MFDEAELWRMSPEDRARLARILVRMDLPLPPSDPGSQRRRRILIAAAIVCAVALAAWIGVLEVKLPRDYRSGGWRAAWVGFDGALLLTFVATAWSAWRRRQMLIACLIVIATLLCCDAWFDTTLDWGTRGFLVSLLSALLIELPLAAMALIGARRLLVLTLSRMGALEGDQKPIAFWRVPLFGDTSTGYRHVLQRASRQVCGQVPDGQRSPSTAAPGKADGVPGVRPAMPETGRC
jgi:hypothetical protein